VGAIPIDVQTSPGGNGVCLKVKCLWKRTFSLQYSCSCNGKSADDVAVPDNVEYYVFEFTDSFPTITLSVGIPIPPSLGAVADALGAVADALGVSIDIAHFWAPGVEAQVNKRAEQDAPTDSTGATPTPKPKIQPGPVAVCGSVIDFGGGNVVPWPATGSTSVVPPDNRTQLECGKATQFTKHSYGWGTGGDPAEAQANAEKRLKLVTPADIQDFVSGYKCAAPCTMVLPPKVVYSAMTITPYNNPPPQIRSTSFWCFASWEWTITFDCVKG
jgi:hypothetical protein